MEIITDQDINRLKNLPSDQKIDFISRLGQSVKKQVLKMIARNERLEKILEILEAYQVKLGACSEHDKVKIQNEITYFVKMLEKYKRLPKKD